MELGNQPKYIMLLTIKPFMLRRARHGRLNSTAAGIPLPANARRGALMAAKGCRPTGSTALPRPRANPAQTARQQQQHYPRHRGRGDIARAHGPAVGVEGLAATVFKPPVRAEAGGLLAREPTDLDGIKSQHTLVRSAK